MYRSFWNLRVTKYMYGMHVDAVTVCDDAIFLIAQTYLKSSKCNYF